MLTALMLSAIAVTLVASLFVQQRYSIRLTGNFQNLEQIYQYAYAAEDLAAVLLKRDRQSNQVDSQFDNWGSENFEPFEIDDDNGEQIGVMVLEIEDMQGRFNVNNLVKKLVQNTAGQNAGQNQGAPPTASINAGQPQPGTAGGNASNADQPRKDLVIAFDKILQQNGVQSAFSRNVIDWIDANDNPIPNGAESQYYLSLEQPYEAANAFLTDPVELQQIKMDGVNDKQEQAEKLAGLTPYITALPTPTSINVNTASKEVLVAAGIAQQKADGIIQWRKNQAIDQRSFQQITGRPLNPPSQGNNQPPPVKMFGISSNYFRLGGEVRLGKSRIFLNSLLFRSDQGDVHVIMRRFSRIPKTS